MSKQKSSRAIVHTGLIAKSIYFLHAAASCTMARELFLFGHEFRSLFEITIAMTKLGKDSIAGEKKI